MATNPDLRWYVMDGYSGAISISTDKGNTWASPELLAAETGFYLRFSVFNESTVAASNVELEVHLNDEILIWRTIDDFGGYYYYYFTYSEYALNPGSYEFTFIIDPANKIKESDESNNTLTYTISVAGSTNWMMQTFWGQKNSILGSNVTINAYAPIDPSTGERCITGCANTAVTQMLYYFATRGYNFTLDLTEDDAFVSGGRINITGTKANANQLGTVSFAEINALLEDFDINSANDVAALCYASGVISKSTFGSSETSTAGMGDKVFKRAGFKSASTAYKGYSDLWQGNNLSDKGWQMIIDNMNSSRPVFTSIPNPAHVIVIDGYDPVSGKVHIDFGWEITGGKKYYNEYSSYLGSGWYSRAECDQLGLREFVYNITPDTQAPVALTVDCQYLNKCANISLDFSDDVGIWKKYYRLKGDATWTEYTGNITVNKNTTIYFKACDRAKNYSAETSYAITGITGNITLSVSADIETVTSGNVTFTLSATGGESQIRYYYSIDSAAWQQCSQQLTVDKNCTIRFYADDLNGNKSETITREVANIDKTPPTLKISGNAENWTNQKVTLSATASDGVIEFFNGSEWVIGNELTVSENGIYYFRATDKAGNVTVQDVEVTYIDKTPPTLKISGNAENWTNQKVTLSATSSDGVIEFFDGSQWIAGNELPVEENGIYYFRATDEAGNVTVQNVEVTYIDRIAPTLEISGNPTEWTMLDVTLTATASDGVIEFFNGSEWVIGNKLTVSENGFYYFRATDEAGNITIQNVEVTYIDKTPPTLKISGNAENWTNQKVTLSATSSDGVIEFFDGSQWIAGNELPVEENGIYYFRATDEAGNVTVQNVEVTYIDRIAPTLEISGNPTEWTMLDVTLTATASDGVIEFFNGSQWIIGNELTVSENGFYLFRVTDRAGNLTETTVNVDKIDKNITPRNLRRSADGVEWDNSVYSDNCRIQLTSFETGGVLNLSFTGSALDLYSPEEQKLNWQLSTDGTNWVTGDEIILSGNGEQQFTSDADGNMDLFFACGSTVWGSGFLAQHSGILDNWRGSGEYAVLAGKNKLAAIYTGSSDANVLVMTDDANGDALFLDDIYTSPGNQARVSMISEIRAGAGNDIVDMTSNKFAYIGEEMIVFAGDGDDVVWANSGSNTLYGDAGNDRLIGGADNDILIGGAGNDRMHGGGGDDIFCFGGDFGNDQVEQLENSSVTLWFAEGSSENWNAETLTYSDGVNSVSVSGVDVENIFLKFGDTASAVAGAFDDSASGKIFEEKQGMLA